MRLNESGTLVGPDGRYAVAWRDVNDAPHFEAPDPSSGQLVLGGAKIDMVEGTASGCMFGTVTLCSGDRTYAGPYDGGALFLDGGHAVQWRAKTLREASADGLVFDDGCEVEFELHCMNISTPLGTGLVRLDCKVVPKSYARTSRRALQRPGARLSPDGMVIVSQQEPGEWPPPPGPRPMRRSWSRGYS
jgi:hypothetical protein